MVLGNSPFQDLFPVDHGGLENKKAKFVMFLFTVLRALLRGISRRQCLLTALFPFDETALIKTREGLKKCPTSGGRLVCANFSSRKLLHLKKNKALLVWYIADAIGYF